MTPSIPGKITSSVETLGRGFVTIGSIIFSLGFVYGAFLIIMSENTTGYNEWPFTFVYIPILVGCSMITVGGKLWHKRWKIDVEFQQWKNNQLKKEDVPIREIYGENYQFDMDQEVKNVD